MVPVVHDSQLDCRSIFSVLLAHYSQFFDTTIDVKNVILEPGQTASNDLPLCGL